MVVKSYMPVEHTKTKSRGQESLPLRGLGHHRHALEPHTDAAAPQRGPLRDLLFGPKRRRILAAPPGPRRHLLKLGHTCQTNCASAPASRARRSSCYASRPKPAPAACTRLWCFATEASPASQNAATRAASQARCVYATANMMTILGVLGPAVLSRKFSRYRTMCVLSTYSTHTCC